MKAQIKINTTAQDFIITLVKIEISGCMHAQLGGGGGYSRFQVTGMIKWAQKSQHQKIPRASNKTPQKYLDQNATPQTLLFVSHCHCYPKKIFAKIFPPKKILKSKISNLTPPPPQSMVITQVTPMGPTTSRTWQVRGPFCKL